MLRVRAAFVANDGEDDKVTMTVGRCGCLILRDVQKMILNSSPDLKHCGRSCLCDLLVYNT